MRETQISGGRPLAGLRFLVTRNDDQENSLTKMLKSKGASVLVIPLLKVVAPESWELFDKTIPKSDKIDWAIFTSINGVLGCLKRIKELKHSPSKIFSKIKIACVGKSTADRLIKNGILPEVVPKFFQTEGLVSELKKYELKGKKFWLIQAESPRKLLNNELKKQRCEIIFTPVYKTIPNLIDSEFINNELEKSGFDWILFGSPSAVETFHSIIPNDHWLNLKKTPKIGCLGQITAKAVKNFGFKVDAKPKVQDFEHLVKKICEMQLKDRSN